MSMRVHSDDSCRATFDLRSPIKLHVICKHAMPPTQCTSLPRRILAWFQPRVSEVGTRCSRFSEAFGRNVEWSIWGRARFPMEHVACFLSARAWHALVFCKMSIWRGLSLCLLLASVCGIRPVTESAPTACVPKTICFGFF